VAEPQRLKPGRHSYIGLDMTKMHKAAVQQLVVGVLGDERADRAFRRVATDPSLLADGEHISRAEFAMALNLLLFDDLLARVPTGAAYVEDQASAGIPICFDHGALRTIRFDGPTGDLPAGETAFRRILEPLGYSVAALYPLPALRMTGYAFRHRDLPERIPQFFVSELHVDRFDAGFAAAAHMVFDGSRDPLDNEVNELLAQLAADDRLTMDAARILLPRVAAAFGRHHDLPFLADYERLLADSAEAAWIATEGNAINHVTDHVPDVYKVAEEQRALGRPIKDSVEVSQSGRIHQTAFRADPVTRCFRTASGDVERSVPGSFYEFITRDVDPATGQLDLGFDSANATGIFAMTKAR
jgi:hypothetical protein